MQTFLPYADYDKTAQCLDRQRLGKQRVENLQILNALTNAKGGWQHHPAVKMWRGYLAEFFVYHTAICLEWTSRGYKDTCLEKFTRTLEEHTRTKTKSGQIYLRTPWWMHRFDFHESHRSNLLRKDPEHYQKHFPDTPINKPYWWPSENLDKKGTAHA